MITDLSTLPPLANCIRALAMDAVERANSGHPGMPMGMADVATVLFARHLTFYPHNPHWPDRDRFILSGGHGSMLLYALSYLTGYTEMTLDDIKQFRQVGSRTPGHPEHDVAVGVETTTGPLGQGVGNAVGMSLAEHLMQGRFGDALVNHRTYVMCGDGDLQEGISHEACALAGHWKLNNLIVLYDDNAISIDGPTSLSFSEDICKRFDAYGWATRRINGHDMADIDDALTWAKGCDRPVLIACKTTIGFGADKKAGTADAHGAPLGPDEIAAARKNLNWPHAPFEIPDNLLTAWRDIGARGRDAYTAWENRLAAADDAVRQAFIEHQSGVNRHALDTAIQKVMNEFTATPKAMATRKASQMVLEHLVPALPNLIGGSADLTGSNLTKVAAHTVIPAEEQRDESQDLPPDQERMKVPDTRFAGSGMTPSPYIHYGVREHGMGAIMNGLALHGGIVPYGGTFLCFADYMRPAIRLAALMHLPVVYVMTHDSIGLGEDGPTHQPIEHLASLRAIPNMRVFRPGDAVETAACWHMALSSTDGPSVLALSRQAVSPLPTETPPPSRGRVQSVHSSPLHPIYRGAYIVRDVVAPRVVIYATGSEVELALSVADALSDIPVRVVSIPSFEVFRAQDLQYRQKILGATSAKTSWWGGCCKTPLLVGIEAGVRQGWDEIIGTDGLFFGLSSFGASGPYKDVYAHFNLTPDAITAAIQATL